MLSIGTLAFLNPWVLAGLIGLPVLWWLLRTIPPSPRTQTFAGVRLLLGLEDEDRQSDKTPWWLLLLRCLAVAAALIGLSQPVSNLLTRLTAGSGPILVLMDQGWASAPEWADRTAAARAILEEADQAGRQVILWPASDPGAPPVTSAKEAEAILGSLAPRPWEPDHASVQQALSTDDRGITETVWLQDGLARDGTEDLLDTLTSLGPLRIVTSEAPANALTPPRLEDGMLRADVLSAAEGGVAQVIALARSESGGERRIAVVDAPIEEGGRATVTIDLPQQLQDTVTRITLADRPSAGGAAFADGAIRRITMGLVAPQTEQAVTTLTSPTHYLEKALVPWADIRAGTLADLIGDLPPAVILADHGDLPEDQREALIAWIEEGGLLIRFAGPRLAASIGAQGFGSAQVDDLLLPVRLRRGGRVLGGALAWSSPRALGPFVENSPFRGLEPPEEVDVRTQVLAEPSPDLADRVWASLDDGTPLVTAKQIGDGQVVLFHISADAEWSSLPLSGLFVEMLGRITALAPGQSSGLPDTADLAGTLWSAEVLMGPNGDAEPVPGIQDNVPGERLASGLPGPDMPPGIYTKSNLSTDRSDAESVVINLFRTEDSLTTFPAAPAGAVVETLGGTAPQRYGPILLAIAVILIALDVLGTLIASGRLGSRTATSTLIFALAAMTAADATAQSDNGAAVEVTAETTLGYIRTGDERIDRTSAAGMAGLAAAMSQRTAVEPGPSVGVNPATDELSFYPVLYMPLTAATLPSREGLEALARYLQGGGMLIIDMQNGASGFGGASATQMREVARALNLPPLQPVGEDHVLTRTFYLLSSFPGRWRGGRIWAEAAPKREVEETADIPQFDRVDDNVSPVIVGSADWAAAWAIDNQGFPMFPIGRPGDRQREMAVRFGVNAVMYALTGNYKSDQVHAPAVLQRLGQ
ncbi:MAG: DUF4159 domain-containing protein [Pseudomonadota bacterium]